MECPFTSLKLEVPEHSGILMKVQFQNLNESIRFGNIYCQWNFMTVKFQIDFLGY